MTKVITIEKLSKKAQKEYYAKQRSSWNGISPVTRCPAKPCSYNRAKQKHRIITEY